MAKKSTATASLLRINPPRRKDVLEQLIGDIHTYNINHHTRELYLHGHTSTAWDEEPGVEYRMATTFIKNIHVLSQQSNKNILIHMHTIGGNWTDGMAMFHTIRMSKSSVTILAYAQASSMSGIILQAADKRVLMPDCEFLVHHGSIALDSNSMAVKSAVDQNEKCCRRMLQIFAKRAINGQFFAEREYSLEKTMGYIDRQIRNRSDWIMSAEEAVYYGLADGILGQKGFENLDKIRSGRKMKEVI